MAYVPKNLNVYTAAFAGAIAGAGVPSGSFIVDPVSGDYAPVANVAAVFAQAVDTAWGAVIVPTQYDVDAIEEVCTNILTKGAGAPMTGLVTTQGNWTIVATAIVALVRAGSAKATADGVTFPPVGGGTGGKVNQVLFVDRVNGMTLAAGADGAIGRQFLNIPDAMTYADAQGYTSVVVFIAPGTYPEPVTILGPKAVSFVGWDQGGILQPVLSGDFQIDTSIAQPPVGFTNCYISAANIAPIVPATDSLNLFFGGSTNCLADITCLNFVCMYLEATQTGNVTAGGVASIRWDGWSWAQTYIAGPTFTITGARTDEYLDAGHNTYPVNLVTNGLAIGTTTIVPTVVSPDILVDDRVQVQVPNGGATDFICGVHSVATGNVSLWITNLSRVSTNFDDPVLLTVHHELMVQLAAP